MLQRHPARLCDEWNCKCDHPNRSGSDVAVAAVVCDDEWTEYFRYFVLFVLQVWNTIMELLSVLRVAGVVVHVAHQPTEMLEKP